MLKTRVSKVCIAAGGTGGHVFPAIALAQELEERGVGYTFITDQRGQAYFKTVKLQQSPVVLPLGSKRPGLIGRLKFAVQIGLSIFMSMRHVWACESVIGFSGFPSFPPLCAGLILRKPLFIHEQNAVLGQVNRLMGRFAKSIFTSTDTVQAPPYLQGKLTFTGMPVREGFLLKSSEAYERPTSGGPFRLVVVGGSQGATSFAEVIPMAIAKLPTDIRDRLHILHQVRPEDAESVETQYGSLSLGSFQVVTFINDMPDVLSKAHLLISRSGASTLSEIEALGCPSILVPLATATDDHQTKNAEELMRRGGAWMMAQRAFQPDHLCAFIFDLLTHPKKLLVASQRVKKGYLKSRIKVLADLVLRV